MAVGIFVPPDPPRASTGAPPWSTIVGVMLDAGRAPPRGELGPLPGRMPNLRSVAWEVKSSSSSFRTKPPWVTSRQPNMLFTVLVIDATFALLVDRHEVASSRPRRACKPLGASAGGWPSRRGVTFLAARRAGLVRASPRRRLAPCGTRGRRRQRRIRSETAPRKVSAQGGAGTRRSPRPAEPDAGSAEARRAHRLRVHAQRLPRPGGRPPTRAAMGRRRRSPPQAAWSGARSITW